MDVYPSEGMEATEPKTENIFNTEFYLRYYF